MRTETVTRIIYTAAELKEHHPEGLQRALEDYARFLENDPLWVAENRDSLAAALAANCAEDAFLDTSNANGWEYYETGELA